MDGAHMADMLLQKNYEVYGMYRRSATDKFSRLRYLNILDNKNFHLVSGDLCDSASINNMVENIIPNEVYHLGAMSFVKESFSSPIATMDINAMGTLRLLEAIRRFSPHARMYNAATSEMFGYETWSENTPMNEDTRFHPRSVYGVSKVSAFYSVQNYREAYNLHASNGILFNHSSELRGGEFVFAKICRGAAEIAAGEKKSLGLGRLDTKRDFGYSPDYVKAMHLMLQQKEPNDYVIGSGKTHSIRDLCESAFMHFGLLYEDYVYMDEKFCRPTDVGCLIADNTKARKKLGWEPTVSFDEMIHRICEFWKMKIERTDFAN